MLGLHIKVLLRKFWAIGVWLPTCKCIDCNLQALGACDLKGKQERLNWKGEAFWQKAAISPN